MTTQATDLELRIRAVLDGIEQLTGFRGELQKSGEAAAGLTEAARKTDTALEALSELQQQIESFRALQARATEVGAALDAARLKQREYSNAVVESLGPSKQQLAEQGRANAEVVKLEARLAALRDRQRDATQAVIAAEQPTANQIKRQLELTEKLGGAERALGVAKQRQDAANAAVAAGAGPSDKLARAQEKATASAESLAAEQQHVTQQLAAAEKALNANGVATGELDQAAGRIRKTFADVAAQTKAFSEAQANLKFVPHEQLQREAQGLRSSYDTLRSSGKLTAQELAQANLKLQEGLLDLERRTNGWKDSLVKAKIEVGAAIAAFAPIAISIKQASEFETALAGVRKVVEGTDDQFDRLSGRIRELTRELPISAAGLADIAAAGGQLGVPLEKLDQFIDLAAKVAVAFNLSADEAGQAVAKLSNIFDIPLERVGELANSINVLGNTTAATEGQILDFLTRVGGTARQFGLTAQSVAALGASLIAMGRTPETAATAVNALLVRLQAANVLAPEARRALDGIGLSAVDLARQIRENPQAALETFLTTLEGLDAQARTESIARILGLEQADKIASLIGNIDQYRDALKNATDQQQVAGALQKEFDAQADTTRQQYQLLKNVIADITLELGTAFLPAVRAAIAAGQSVAEAISEIVSAAPGLSAVAVSLVSVGAAMSGLRLAGAAARVAVTGLLGSLVSAAPALAGVASQSTAAAGSVSGLARVLTTLPKLVGIGIVLAGAEAVIGALINIRRIQGEIAEREAETQKGLDEGIAAAAARMAEYAGQAARSSAALESLAQGTSQLTETQRQHYAKLLAGTEEYLKAQLALGVRESERYGKTEIDLQAVRARLTEVRAALEQLQRTSDATQPISIDQLVSPDLLPKLKEVGAAIGQISSEDLATLKDQAQVAFGATLVEIEKVSAAFPALQGAALEAALALDSRFAGLISTKRELGAALETLRDEQYKRLGIDAGAVLTGIDAKAKDLLATFQSLISDPSVDPRILTAAFRELLQTLDSPEELEALRVSLAKVQQAGFDTAGAVAEIEKKLADVASAGDKAATAVSEAFKRAGIQTRDEIAAAARQAQADFELIARSGQATAEGLAQAFERSAEAQIKLALASSQGAAESVAGFLRAQAATDAQRAAVDRLIERYIAKGAAASRAGDAAAAGSGKAAAALDRELSAIDAVEAAYQRRTAARDGKGADGLTPSSSGGVASAGAIDPRYFGLTAEQRAEVDALFSAGFAQVVATQRRLDGGLNSSSSAPNLAQNQLSADVRSLITNLLSGREQPQPGRTIDININLPGIGSARVSATPDQAQALEALLRELERQLAVAGVG